MNPVPTAVPKAAARLLRAPRQCSNPGATTTMTQTQVRGYTESGAGRRLREGGVGRKEPHWGYVSSRVGVTGYEKAWVSRAWRVRGLTGIRCSIRRLLCRRCRIRIKC